MAIGETRELEIPEFFLFLVKENPLYISVIHKVLASKSR